MLESCKDRRVRVNVTSIILKINKYDGKRTVLSDESTQFQ
ncbi:hypothetical protein Marme_2733 [Marinomonas mediterranea MMB-1]|uniref:Uncharacterized protein n=1 Tax=Marinomonas mediterranea (strain ATCC 700492 / JCM 21426 / NBRC 103028 / MMB-1) TaxID=717774 RepID=F2JYD0_MARM1|nr:hypothetical protein Marme_2733 [Marinomonas mediterranea MMB-1]